MAEKRKAYAPFSLITESGVANAPVEGYIDVNQEIQPIVSTGTVNEKGTWVGVKSSDNEFFGITTHLVVANGATVLAPATANTDFIDMTGFNDIQIAIRPTNAGNYAIIAVMGPDTNSYANLNPVNAAATLRGSLQADGVGTTEFGTLLQDNVEALTADVWNIFYVQGRVANQKMMQIKITNNSGGDSDIEAAFMRLV